MDGQVTIYAYAPDSNRLATVDDGTGPVSFAYDAAGNTLTDGSRTFGYDARNRMTTADSHAYGYNALGQRAFKPRFQTAAPGDADGDGVIDQNDLLALRDMIKGKIPASPGADCNGDGAVDNQDTSCIARQIGAAKNRGKGKNSEPETSTVTTTAMDGDFTQAGWVLFAYDEAGRLIGEYDEAGSPIRQYVWLEDLPVAVISTEGIHYLHADHLNTPKVVTDSLGTIVWQADYQPFGEVTELVDTLELNLRFPGQYHDRETGLHQNWHREYVPELGRYSQSDPIGLFDGPNTYSFVLNNPVNQTDKTGMFTILPDEMTDNFFQSLEDASRNGYYDCLFDCLAEKALPPSSLFVVGEVTSAVADRAGAPERLARIYHTQIRGDRRFTAGGQRSRILVPRTANTLKAFGRTLSVVGFSLFYKDIIVCTNQCLECLN